MVKPSPSFGRGFIPNFRTLGALCTLFLMYDWKRMTKHKKYSTGVACRTPPRKQATEHLTLRNCHPYIMKYTHPVTPSDTQTAAIRLIREHLKTPHALVYIESMPLPGAQVDDCFPTVDEHVRTNGGSRVLGWSIWELPGIYVEAEFHAVWKGNSGELLDITPKKEATRRILFLQDDSTPYEGYQVNNIRVPIKKDPAVVAFLEACEKEFNLLNEGERKGMHGEIRLGGTDASRYSEIMQEKMMAMAEMIRFYPTVGPYTPCHCGSGFRTKWCCKVKT